MIKIKYLYGRGLCVTINATPEVHAQIKACLAKEVSSRISRGRILIHEKDYENVVFKVANHRGDLCYCSTMYALETATTVSVITCDTFDHFVQKVLPNCMGAI